MTKTPVILFGDHIAAYGVIRSLGPKGIPIYVVSPKADGVACASRYVKKSLPLSYEAPDFIERLNRWMAETVGPEAVLMVCGTDQYLDILSQNSSAFPSGVRPSFPPWSVVEAVRKKAQTYSAAERLGILVPRTFLISSREELVSLLEQDNGIELPALMKAENSGRMMQKVGTRGIVCHSGAEMLSAYESCDGFWGELLLQEYVPGPESALYCLKTALNRRSEPLGVFVDRKVRSDRAFGSCSITTSTWSDAVVDCGLRLLKSVGYCGYASVEFKYDERHDCFKLMEINGRFSLNNSHALKCGVDLADMVYREFAQGPEPPLKNASQTYPAGVLWWDAVKDVRPICHHLKKGQLRLLMNSFRGMFSRGTIVEPWSWRDPRTMAYYSWQSLRYKISQLWKAIKR